MSQRLAAAVKAARQQRGWSQRDLAQRLGVDNTYLSKIETNGLEYPPTEEKLIRLAELLDLNPTQVVLQAGRIPTQYQHLIAELVLAYGEELPQLLTDLLSQKAATAGGLACNQCSIDQTQG